VAKSAREVLRVAEEIGDDATADVVTPRITLHEKTAWMLRATAS
jgi:starvation-inducible DNA-binding protein